MTVSLIALGAGAQTLTAEAAQALQGAGLVVGAQRLLQLLPPGVTPNRVAAVRTEELARCILQSGQKQVAAVFSGDVGFYSGAGLLAQRLAQSGAQCRWYPGVSSLQLLAARLGCAWQNWLLASAHGRACDPVPYVMQGKSVLFLTGGENTAAVLCQKLAAAGLGALPCCAGQSLGTPQESILHGTAAQLVQRQLDPLTVLLAGPAPQPLAQYGPWLPDDAFIRGKTPMTKQLVRAAVLQQLHPVSGDVCWDVGGGTGSVAIALSRAAARVYTVEASPEACGLIAQNREKLGAWNLTALCGSAPAALQGLPAPDKVFVGGSKGKMKEILETVLAANPAARVCASAVTLETLGAACAAMQQLGLQPTVSQIAVSDARAVGGLHMMTAQNPVWLITGQKA